MQEAHCTSLGGTPGSPTRSEPQPVEPGRKMERREKAINKSYKVKDGGCDTYVHIWTNVGVCRGSDVWKQYCGFSH